MRYHIFVFGSWLFATARYHTYHCGGYRFTCADCDINGRSPHSNATSQRHTRANCNNHADYNKYTAADARVAATPYGKPRGRALFGRR
jgi:hypothetical protein